MTAAADFLAAIPAGLWVDIALLLLLCLGVWQSMRRGFKAELLGTLAFLAATLVIWLLYPRIHHWVVNENVWRQGILVLRIALLLIITGLFFLISRASLLLFGLLLNFEIQPATDRALALFTGLIRGAAYGLIALLLIFTFVPPGHLEDIRANSFTGRHLLPRFDLEKLPKLTPALIPQQN